MKRKEGMWNDVDISFPSAVVTQSEPDVINLQRSHGYTNPPAKVMCREMTETFPSGIFECPTFALCVHSPSASLGIMKVTCVLHGCV
ncbi:hypothetical protein EG68_00125 [Paragonimus skrjabini miyazakii]|uniref:Uncharacterized protein n=1 Tax=Paragonimus skrjabini miyazakii TaxID=59628 RepID=A0A8S9Z7G5_9TREM|nr:hypothetical protein EG68_00125 [Paragonimus skrjabini miyazakii]